MEINAIIVKHPLDETTIILEEWLNPSTMDVIERSFMTITELSDGSKAFPFYHDSLIEAVEHACDQSSRYHNAWRIAEIIAHKAMQAHDRRGVVA